MKVQKGLTVILSSLSSMFIPSFFHDMVGSGCPRGGWHSRTAGSPAATITSAGFCRKSSRRTAKLKTETSVYCTLYIILYFLILYSARITCEAQTSTGWLQKSFIKSATIPPTVLYNIPPKYKNITCSVRCCKNHLNVIVLNTSKHMDVCVHSDLPLWWPNCTDLHMITHPHFNTSRSSPLHHHFFFFCSWHSVFTSQTLLHLSHLNSDDTPH